MEKGTWMALLTCNSCLSYCELLKEIGKEKKLNSEGAHCFVYRLSPERVC